MATPTVTPSAGEAGKSSPSPTPAPAQQSGTTSPTPSPSPRPVRPINRDPDAIHDGRAINRVVGPPKAKNINPLPGVVDAVERGEETPEEQGERESREQLGGPERDPSTGRFVSREAAPQDETQTQTQENKAKAGAEAEPAKPSKLKFLGKDYDDLTAVEHLHKTLQGNFSSEKTRADKNYEAALAWQRKASQLEDQLKSATTSPQHQHPQSAGRGTSPAPGHDPSATSEPSADFAESFDWNTYNHLRTVEKNEMAATIFMMEAMQSHLLQKFESRLQPFVQSEEQQRADQEFVHAVRGVFQGMSELQAEETGEFLYPELRDPQTREAFAKFWANYGWDREIAKTPRAIHATMMDFRHRNASSRATQPPAATSPAADSEAAASAVTQSVAQAIHAQQSRGGVVEPPPSPGMVPNGPRGGDPSENLRAGIRNARHFGDGKTGLRGVTP